MKKTEICLHCNADYLPTRRGIQKFCSKSCKSRYWYLKQNNVQVSELVTLKNNVLADVDVQTETKKNSMSFAGVGNAAAGVAMVEVVKSIFTAEDNKPATKKEIRELKSMINGGRYFPVNIVPKDAFGKTPYYDIETGYFVYF